MRQRFFGAVIAVLLLVDCSGGGSSPSPSTPSPGPSPSSPPIQSGEKLPLHGLVSMGAQNFSNGSAPDNTMEEINAHPGVYSGAVINARWSDLEPQQGVFDDTTIDRGLSAIASYNAAHPAGPTVTGKLRIHTGNATPAWVLALDANGPITVQDGTSIGTVTIGAFWSSAYRTAWRGLQAHLAARYDANPALQEVAISSCSSITAEPFITPLDAESLVAMRASGYSDASDMACLSAAPQDYAAWARTPLDYTFNIFRASDTCTAANDTKCITVDQSFTDLVMQEFRSGLGSRAILANHGLNDPLTTAAIPVYAQLSSLGPAIEFQTYAPTVDWNTVVPFSLQYHPTELEIWQTTAAGGPAPLTQPQLESFAADLQS